MPSPALPIDERGPELSLLALADENLEEIFLNLPGPAALARASTSCASFRRVITERAFLRRFRKLHPPPLLGLVDEEGVFLPAQAPHPSAPLSRALVDAADFTYSFVPKPDNGGTRTWFPRDARGGRVLLEHSSRFFVLKTVFTDLAVCDPLSRRYVLLPSIPEDMAIQEEHLLEFRPMLAPIGEDEGETSFKVFCVARYRSKVASFLFSSVTGQWCVAASSSWSSMGAVEPTWKRMYRVNYFRGCFYWTDLWSDKLLVLDTGIMEFSTVDVLTGYHVQLRNQPGLSVCMSIIVDGTKGALEMLTLVGDYSPTSFSLYHTVQQDNGGSSNEWQLKNVMELPRRWLCSTICATEGFLFLRCVREARWDDNALGLLPEDNLINLFSLEVKTFELKQVCTAKYHPNCVHSYFGFPPSLSKPSL
ncbi:unnamed protein product [Alopecurus aequalis]